MTCEFFDTFGVHAHMGGRVDLSGNHREDWTTCCDAYTPTTEDGRHPLGGEGCMCDLPNGLANHTNEQCPHWVLVY